MDSEKDITLCSSSLAKRGYLIFKDMKDKQDLCDITFRFENVSISAHRIILAAGIPFFRKTFSDQKAIETELPDVDPTTFHDLVEFAYTSKVVISKQNVQKLLHAAHNLGVDEVCGACCDFLIRDMNPQNVFSVRDLACDINYPELQQKVDQYIIRNFKEMSRTEGFFNLPLSCILEILGSDDLCVSSEEDIFEAAINWVKMCPDERKDNLPDLLVKVRMPHLNPLYLKNRVSKEDLVHKCIQCRDLLDEARNFHLFPDDKSQISSFSLKPRHSDTPSYISFSHSHIGSNTTGNEKCLTVLARKVVYEIDQFKHGTNKWHKTAEITLAEYDGLSIGVGNKMYYIKPFTTMQFDPLKSGFKLLKPIPTYRYFAETVALDDEIYVCGGTLNANPKSCSKVVECYDTRTDAWRSIINMTTSRSNFGVVALGNCIYVLGGHDGNIFLNSVEMYDLGLNVWQNVPSMLTKRSDFGSASLNGRIYVCGGTSNDGKCVHTAEMYSKVKKKWKFIASMRTPRKSFTLLPYRGKLFAVGGNDENYGSLNTVEIYDPETDQWKIHNSLPIGVLVDGVAVMTSD